MLSLSIDVLPAVSQSLVDVLARKDICGEVSAVPELWRRLVYRELEWCSDNFSALTPRHRDNCAALVDWHHRHYGYTHDHWLKFYSSEKEMYRRQAVAELCFCAANVFELTRRHRILAIDLLQQVCNEAPELYNPAWKVLNDLPILNQ